MSDLKGVTGQPSTIPRLTICSPHAQLRKLWFSGGQGPLFCNWSGPGGVPPEPASSACNSATQIDPQFTKKIGIFRFQIVADRQAAGLALNPWWCNHPRLTLG